MPADQVVLQNDYGRAVYTPQAGASLRSLSVAAGRDRIELLSGGDGPHDPGAIPSATGCFIMAPWPNRIRDGLFEHRGRRYSVPVNSPPHAMHGTVRRRPFEVVEHTESSARFAIDLGRDWPFDGTLAVDVSLDGPSLVQSFEISTAAENFPAGFGWHPWFRRNLGAGDAALQAGVEARWILDADMTPTGETVAPQGIFDLRRSSVPDVGSMDECFRMAPGGGAVLRWPELALTIASSPDLGHLQVYTPPDSICVEPQTCCVNAFQLAADGHLGTGVVIVEPGAPLRGTTRWSWAAA